MDPSLPLALNPASAATVHPSASASAAQNALISSDFQTFLNMLTTQMRNQDPLNPVDSSDFAVQLATFSGVEQQVRGNQLLESLAAQLGVMGIAQLSGWVGMEARALAPAVFDGRPVPLSPRPEAGADHAVLVVRDARGEEVQRQDLTLPAAPLEWTGTGEGGRILSEGLYTFEVESHVGGGLLAVTPVETFSRVIEARLEGGQTILTLEGGVDVPAAAVAGIRAPNALSTGG
jgi:flagellar basal-body rod modification protein FlgD